MLRIFAALVLLSSGVSAMHSAHGTVMDPIHRGSIHTLVEKLKTSPETVEQKAAMLADAYVQALNETLDSEVKYGHKTRVYDLLRKTTHDKYNSLPLTHPKNSVDNLALLQTQKVQDALHGFLDERVSAIIKFIKTDEAALTQAWSAEHKKAFQDQDVVALVKKGLYDKIYGDLVANQKLGPASRW